MARLILGYKVNDISRKNLYAEIGWLTVKKMIQVRTLMMLRKVIKTGEPSSIHQYLQSLEITHGYNTRCALNSKKVKLFTKPTYTKATFLATSFRTKDIDSTTYTLILWQFIQVIYSITP